MKDTESWLTCHGALQLIFSRFSFSVKALVWCQNDHFPFIFSKYRNNTAHYNTLTVIYASCCNPLNKTQHISHSIKINISASMFNCVAVKDGNRWLLGSQVMEQNASRMRNATFQKMQCFYIITVNFNVSIYYRVVQNWRVLVKGSSKIGKDKDSGGEWLKMCL